MSRFNRLILLIFVVWQALAAVAQSASDYSFKFYGRVRADLFYNTRANEETVDGLFYMYPKDHSYDALGEDLNATPQGNMYVLYTRLGVDMKGPMIGNAKSTAKIELDFRGTGTSYAVTRLRHAYVNLDWGTSALLVGQTWHPLFGDVSPSVLNLSTGAPFQPFNRSPLARYRYTSPRGLMLTAAAVWQSQYTSAGPDGKTWNYLKNSCMPELYASIDYKRSGLLVGAGVDVISLKPRKQSTVNGNVYKVSERVTGVSGEAHFKYTTPDWLLSGKTVLASNLTHCSTLGGYAVTQIDAVTSECNYTPFRHSATWINFVYGKKWQPGLFVGYLKNLGTGKEITSTTYGTGLDVDQILNISGQFTYNVTGWKIGLELTPCWAWYGSLDLSNGHVVDTHSVANFRILGVVMYTF